jgi:ribosome-associated heat shock protein Hsp15
MDSVRLDVYLWAIRAYKTRSQAKVACDGGKVSVNDTAGKPATAVKVGDQLVVRGETRRVLTVRVLSERRGPAPEAKLLYDDLTPIEPPQSAVAYRESGAGRPTKRDRRLTERLLGHDE